MSVRLLGKAAFQLGEHAQAEAAYRQAVAVNPSLLLAWKGLSELLNSQSAVTSAFIETQEKMVWLSVHDLNGYLRRNTYGVVL